MTLDVDPEQTTEQLRTETKKWQEKLETRLEHVSAVDEGGEELLENARAYHTDVPHFKEENDWVRAFEAVVWGWSWLEIGERIGKIEEKEE